MKKLIFLMMLFAVLSMNAGQPIPRGPIRAATFQGLDADAQRIILNKLDFPALVDLALSTKGTVLGERVKQALMNRKEEVNNLFFSLEYPSEQNLPTLQYLLNTGMNPNMMDNLGSTLLYKVLNAPYGSNENKLKAVRMLLNAKANPNVGSRPALYVAAYLNWDEYAPKIIDALLQAGANINAVVDGKSILSHANHPKLKEYLESKGAK